MQSMTDPWLKKLDRQSSANWTYICMNEDLTRELKATHYKFTLLLEGVGTRLGVGKAFMAVDKFSWVCGWRISRFLRGSTQRSRLKMLVVGAWSCNRGFSVYQ